MSRLPQQTAARRGASARVMGASAAADAYHVLTYEGLTMRIGVHVGTSGGLASAAEYARSVGCECIQIFAKSPMRWRGPRFAAEEIAAFRHGLTDSAVVDVVTHTAYLLNLSGPDPELRERSWRALADEIERAAQLGASAVITHVGTHPDGDAAAAAGRLADSLRRAREAAASTVPVLLENSAGAGSLFLASVEDFARTFEALAEDSADFGVCVDTCHAHAAGIAVGSERDWDALLDALEDAAGRGAVKAVHANDCAGALGSRKDRHAWIGEGTIGESGFAAMLSRRRLRDVPCLLEMPGEIPGKDTVNMARLRSLA